MKKTIILFIFLLSPLMSTFAQNSFVVAPGHVTFNLSHPETQTFLVLNNGQNLIHVRADLAYYPIDSPILKLGKRLNQAYNDNLVPHMLISPPILVLRPGEQRKLRVSVLPPPNLKPGAYRGYVKFSMLELVNTGKQHKKKSTKKLNIAINIHLNTIVSVYAHKGDGKAKLVFICHKKGTHNTIQITNNTPWIGIGHMTQGKKTNHVIVALPYSEQQISLKGSMPTYEYISQSSHSQKLIQCG